MDGDEAAQATRLCSLKTSLFYEKKAKTLAMDQDIYDSSLNEHLQESTFRIKSWITVNKLLIRLSMKEKREKNESHNIKHSASFADKWQ